MILYQLSYRYISSTQNSFFSASESNLSPDKLSFLYIQMLFNFAIFSDILKSILSIMISYHVIGVLTFNKKVSADYLQNYHY